MRIEVHSEIAKTHRLKRVAARTPMPQSARQGVASIPRAKIRHVAPSSMKRRHYSIKLSNQSDVQRHVAAVGTIVEVAHAGARVLDCKFRSPSRREGQTHRVAHGARGVEDAQCGRHVPLLVCLPRRALSWEN